MGFFLILSRHLHDQAGPLLKSEAELNSHDDSKCIVINLVAGEVMETVRKKI